MGFWFRGVCFCSVSQLLVGMIAFGWNARDRTLKNGELLVNGMYSIDETNGFFCILC